VISSTLRGKLKTAAKGFANLIDRLLESRKARIIAALGAVIGVVVGVIQLVIWIAP
jgi:uncharacterized membrane protein YheB (UPF0754 family)